MNYPKQFFVCIVVQMALSCVYSSDYLNWKDYNLLTIWTVINMICFTVFAYSLFKMICKQVFTSHSENIFIYLLTSLVFSSLIGQSIFYFYAPTLKDLFNIFFFRLQLICFCFHSFFCFVSLKAYQKQMSKWFDDESEQALGNQETLLVSSPVNKRRTQSETEKQLEMEKIQTNNEYAEQLLELGLGLDSETIKVNQLRSRSFQNNNTLSRISEENLYSDLDARNRERSRKFLKQRKPSIFDLKWPIPVIDIQEVIKKTDPEFFYEQYKPMLLELQKQQNRENNQKGYNSRFQSNEVDYFQNDITNQFFENQFGSI